MHWCVRELSPPTRKDGVAECTRWKNDTPCERGRQPVPGKDYIVDEQFVRDNFSRDLVLFPSTPLLQPRFRHQWIIQRRNRPHVPSPAYTPMPDRENTAEGSGRLFSVYMRPWVLDHGDASTHVPHIVDLDKPIVSRAIGLVVKRRRFQKTIEDHHLVARS